MHTCLALPQPMLNPTYSDRAICHCITVLCSLANSTTKPMHATQYVPFILHSCTSATVSAAGSKGGALAYQMCGDRTEKRSPPLGTNRAALARPSYTCACMRSCSYRSSQRQCLYRIKVLVVSLSTASQSRRATRGHPVADTSVCAHRLGRR